MSKHLGTQITWNDTTHSVIINTYQTQIELIIGKAALKVNGKIIPLLAPVQMRSNKTYVPLRAIAEALNQNVTYTNGFITINGGGIKVNEDNIPIKFAKLKQGLPFTVYKDQIFVEGFVQLDNAIKHAERLHHASIVGEDGALAWDNYLPYRVYQNEKFLIDLKSYAESVVYAKQYVNSSVYFSLKNQKVWNNQEPQQTAIYIEAPHVLQLPELARGCEVTALTMLLQHAGVIVDKMQLAKEIKKDPTEYKEKDGRIYFGDPNVGFVGDMETFNKPGFGVYHGPIAELAESYLPDRIIDLTGAEFQDILYFINRGVPVWIITNMKFEALKPEDYQLWITPGGEMTITRKEHSVLIVGYDDKFIYINDPNGITEKVEKKPFIEAWDQMGKQAITYVENKETV
nr:C39 family peptidase [Paenibacillus psychroresistens]